MNFVSATFAIFLLVVFSLYWAVGSRVWQNRLLLVAGYVFYGWWDWRFCGLLLLTCVVDYAVARAMERHEEDKVRKRFLWISLISNLGVLGFFKYFNFFEASFISMMGELGVQINPWVVKVILPVGISFYTFQSLAYVIDVYRRKMPAVRDVVDFLAFGSFFPQLVAGPIERAWHLYPQFTRPRRFDAAQARDGCRQILWGIAKKVIVADNLAQHVDAAFGTPDRLRGITLLLMAVFFTFQIYCDFSAYSDIAIGTARLFGFELSMNFRYPLLATSPVDFWRRWHMSLSTWFRDYVYIPLGGNRKGPIRHLLNLLITFTISGLWHGAAATFLVWGFYHGIIIVINHALNWAWEKTKWAAALKVAPNRILGAISAVAGNLLTLTLVVVGFVIFRAENWNAARNFLEAIVERPWMTRSKHLVDRLRYQHTEEISTMVFLVLLLLFIEWLQRKQPHPLQIAYLSRPVRWMIYTLLVWTSLYFYNGSSLDFIYFQF